MPRLQRAKTCQQSVEKGVAFLLSHVSEEGPIGGVEDLGRVALLPLVLAHCGRVEEMQWLLEWAGGRLAKPDETGPVPVEALAWLGLGAHEAARYDLSFALAARLVACQGKSTGGVYEEEGVPRVPGQSTVHLVPTAAAGLLFLACGLLAEARRAANFLREALARQPRSGVFHARFDHRGLPAPRPAEQGASDRAEALGARRLPHDLDRSKGGQVFDILGLPEVFLARLHLASGEAQFLDAAKGYAHVAHRVDSDIWRSASGCISAWGEATLYRITRRRRYLRFAERLVGHLIDSQEEDGRWTPARAEPSGDDGENAADDPAGAIETTARVVHALLECLREVQ